MQTDPVSFDSVEDTNHVTLYTDTATQTDELNIAKESNRPERITVERAPVPSGRSRSFHVKMNQSKGECQELHMEPLVAPPAANPPRQSIVRWQGIENATQTDSSLPEVIEGTKSNHQQKKMSSSLTETIQKHSKTISLSSGYARCSFQPHSALRNPDKSINECTSLTNGPAKSFEKLTPANVVTGNSPSRRLPSPPPLCTQCAAPRVSKTPELQVELDLERANYSPQSFSTSHTCMARSLQCIQCFPSIRTSPRTSPSLPSSGEVECEDVQCSHRSTRPIIPVSVTHTHEATRRPLRKPDHVPDSRVLEAKTPKQWIQRSIEDFAKWNPIPEPEKRPSLPKLWLQSAPLPESILQQPMCATPAVPKPKPLPSLPKPLTVLNTSPPCVPDFASPTLSSLNSASQTDRRVFKGLHVATAAACDEDVDSWIEEITGCGVRKFLADLSAFDGLGINTLAGVAKRAAKQRKQRVGAWEAVREKRVLEEEEMVSRRLNQGLGMVASDQSEISRNQEAGHKGNGWLTDKMLLGNLDVRSKERQSEGYVSSETGRSRGWEEEIEWRLK
jgi:hypothetical protein